MYPTSYQSFRDSPDDHDGFEVEERVCKCASSYCHELLRIKVYIAKTDLLSVPIIKRGTIAYIAAIREDGLHGACISWKRVRQTPWKRFSHGPVPASSRTFVHCKRCFQRIDWTKFKKLDI